MEAVQGLVAVKGVASNSRTGRNTRLPEGIGEEGVEEATPRDID